MIWIFLAVTVALLANSGVEANCGCGGYGYPSTRLITFYAIVILLLLVICFFHLTLRHLTLVTLQL